MDKKIASLLGAVGALATIGSAHAATIPDPAEVLTVRSYADLLNPIPNAMAVLEAIDNSASKPVTNVQVAQFFEHHHHHHHHHHRYYRRYGDEPAIVVVPRYRRDYHHHHHHHHSYYRRYRDDD